MCLLNNKIAVTPRKSWTGDVEKNLTREIHRSEGEIFMPVLAGQEYADEHWSGNRTYAEFKKKMEEPSVKSSVEGDLDWQNYLLDSCKSEQSTTLWESVALNFEHCIDCPDSAILREVPLRETVFVHKLRNMRFISQQCPGNDPASIRRV